MMAPRVLWLASVAAAAMGAVLYRFDPMRVGFYPRCPIYLLTGFYCPGCGGLRAGHALLHGHFLEALGYNPLLVLALAVFLAVGVWRLAGGSLPRGFPMTPSRAAVLGAAVVAFTLLRNVPAGPFRLLAP